MRSKIDIVSGHIPICLIKLNHLFSFKNSIMDFGDVINLRTSHERVMLYGRWYTNPPNPDFINRYRS